jgi:hypothetical protein
MSEKLCVFVSPDRIPCPAYATADSAFCPVHRDKDLITRVPKPRMKAPPPIICVVCGEPIVPGTLMKTTPAGPKHAEFLCG